ncbi:MAG: hypothetical protein JNK53_08055, partial [Phycisphaerae bacterium]|nr:hypothetical protein [Phycisphaerae bacterium]
RAQFAAAMCGGAFLAVAGAHSAHADVTSATYTNSQNYNYKISGMPDFDQKRDDLPDNGDMYCAPTSAINLYAYAANHGFPTQGLPNWTYQSQSHFDAVTNAIELMGTYMGTSPSGGTTCCIASALWTWNFSNPMLKHTVRYLTSDYTPGIAKMTSLACSGWIMSFAYGKYEVTGTHSGNPVLNRTGGHVVTLNYSWRSGASRLLTYRDPSSDASLPEQSTFSGKMVSPFNYTGWYPNAGLRTMAGLFYSSSAVARVMDSHFGIRPIYGVRFVGSPALAGNEAGAGGGTIEQMDPVPFEGSSNASLPAISLPSSLRMIDMHLNPGAGNALVIADSVSPPLPSRLRTLDLMTGELVVLPDAPAGLKRMEINRFDQIVAFDGNNVLYRMDENGTVMSSNSIVSGLSDIAVDDVDDRVWLLSISNRKLFKVWPDFSRIELSFDVPANVPMSGEGHLVIDPTNHVPYVKTDGSVKFWRITPPSGIAGAIGTAMPLPGAGAIQSIFMGDDGTLYVGDGSVRTFKKDPGGSWVVDTSSPFNGLPSGEHLAMLRSTSNYDPDLHGGVAWQNIQPAQLEDNTPELSDCDADFNGDRIVNGADLGLLLTAWNTNGVYDLNNDNVVNGADLGLLLANWGTCP